MTIYINEKVKDKIEIMWLLSSMTFFLNFRSHGEKEKTLVVFNFLL